MSCARNSAQELQRVQKSVISYSEDRYPVQGAFNFSHCCTCILSVAIHSQSLTLLKEGGFWAHCCSEAVTMTKNVKFILRLSVSTGRNSTAYIMQTFIGVNAFLSQNNYNWSELQVTKAWQIGSAQSGGLEITFKRSLSPRRHNKWVRVHITHSLNML